MPIRAHSIQDKRVLDVLCLNDHVIMPQLRFDGKDGAPIVEFKKVGRKDATIFKGLCATHDNEIFSPIEDFEVELDNPQQLFLFGYRATVKRFHEMVSEATRLQKMYESLVEFGRASHQPGDSAMDLVMQSLMRTWILHQYKAVYDEAYLAKRYDILSHEKFSFRHHKPTVAVSSLYWLEILIPERNQIPWIALNVIPSKNETHVVFSYLTEDAKFLSPETQAILNSSLKRRLWLLSEKIVGFTDNFVLSPAFWNSLSHKRRDTFFEYYRATLTNKKSFEGDLRDICLFEPLNEI